MNAILALALALVPLAPRVQEPPPWLLVWDAPSPLAGLPAERLAAAYLAGERWERVAPEAAGARPATSRMVVGALDRGPVAQLAARVGVGLADGALCFRGRAYPGEAGLVLVADDPDGGGWLVLFTAAGEEGLASAFSVPVDPSRHGYRVARRGEVLEAGEGPTARPVVPAPEAVPIVRLDRAVLAARAALPEGSGDEAALLAARALEGHRALLERALWEGVDLVGFHQHLFARHGAELDRVARVFGGPELEEELAREVRRVLAALGSDEPAPLVHLVLTRPTDTNASTSERDPASGRRRVQLDLAAFEGRDDLRLALVHELVHVAQGDRPFRRLAERAVAEGVACHLSQVLRPGTSDAAALMWSAEELAAAEARRAAIVDVVRARAGTPRGEAWSDLVHRGVPLAAVPGAPDRCAYYAGWLAARAWCAAHPERPAVELLSVPPAEVLAALDG